jgi:uncharacterized protein
VSDAKRGSRRFQPWRYQDRWALVTGASAGLGEEFARQLAERGMNLVISARRLDRLSALASELAQRHAVEVIAAPADLARPGAAAELWARATDGRDVHLLVNNAGFGAQGDFHQVPRERQVEMVQLNCTALLELAHLALAGMRERGDGGIVNVASIAAYQPVPTLATYAASKAFVLSLSEALWSENVGTGVRVLALSPGRTPTEFQGIAGTGSTEGAFGLRTPQQVVAAGLRALERGRPSIVPGLENHLAAWLVRLVPRSALTRALRSLVRRRAARKAQG